MKPLELGDTIEVRERVLPHFKGTGDRWEVIGVGSAGSIQVAKVGVRGPKRSTAMWLLGRDLWESRRLGDLVTLGRVIRPGGAAGQVHYIGTCSSNVKPTTHAHTRDAELVSCPRCRARLEEQGRVEPSKPEVVVDLWSYERKRPERVRRISGTREEAIRAALDHPHCRLIEPWLDMLRLPRTLLRRTGGTTRVRVSGPWADAARELLKADKEAALQKELERYLEDLREHGPSQAAAVGRRLKVSPRVAARRLGQLRKLDEVLREKRTWRAKEAT